MYALLSKKLVEESKRYQYLKTEVNSLHIFDHTVKPILLYCSEIWGCYLPKSADFNFMFDYSRLSSVLPCDKLHIHFCKYILGANKTSTNFATSFGHWIQ
jgi:hypothetical protein